MGPTNSLADAIWPRQSGGSPDAAMRRAVASIRPGWMVLKHCALGSPAEPLRCIRYALVHPKVGVALLDIVPDPPAREPLDRLRRALDVLEVRAIFGSWPPIVYRRLALAQLSELGIVLAAAFAFEAPLALGGGDAWVGAVLRALAPLPLETERAPMLVAEPCRQPDPILVQPEGRAGRRDGLPLRPRAMLYGCRVVSALGGTLLIPDAPSWLVRTGPAISAVNPDPVAIPMLPMASVRADPPDPGIAQSQLDAIATVNVVPPSSPANALAAAPAVLAVSGAPVDVAPSPMTRLSERPMAAMAGQRSPPLRPEQPARLDTAVISRPPPHSSRPVSVPVRPGYGNAADEHCQAIILRVQLGKEPSDADRAYLRRGCPRG